MAETETTEKHTPENKKHVQKNNEPEVLPEPVIPSLADYTIHGVHEDHTNVFFGRLSATGLEVVIKGSKRILVSGYDPEYVGQKCLQYEYALQAELDHPHILSPLEIYYQDGKTYLVTPKIGKSDLNPELEEIQSLPDSTKLTYLAQIANALEYSHKNGIIHHDVKGRNIRVENKKAILIDWGAAKKTGETPDLISRIHWSTPETVAPEFRFSQTSTPSADVFSLCCLAYRLLARKEPFVFDDILNMLIYNKPTHSREDIEKFKAGEIIREGMAMYRNQRPDMAELEGVLKEEAARWDPQPSEQPSEPSPVLVQ